MLERAGTLAVLSLTGALACTLALSSCQTDRNVRRPDHDAAGDKPQAGDDGPETTLTKGPRRHAGVAHSGSIDRVALAPDGGGALTRDLVGGTRLWPALDGSREPVVVPMRSPQTFSLARNATGWTIFAVDASGGAKIFVSDAKDHIDGRGELPPFQPLIEGHVLPGGKHVLALFRDHSIRLLDVAGKELARLEQRKFRPVELRISADGKRAVALIEDRDTSNNNKLEIQPLDIVVLGKASITRVGTPRLTTSTVEINPSTAALSPDGGRMAVVQKFNSTAWEVEVIDLRSEAKPDIFTVQAQGHTIPGVGFIAPTRLFAAANDGSVSWLIDVENKSTHPRTAPPADFNTQLRVQAFGADHHVAGHGNWLYVADAARGEHRFLGYRTLQATSLAISPDAKQLATVFPQGPVWVEPLGDEGPEGFTAKLPIDPMNSVFRVRFADDEHVILVDGLGGVRLVAWKTGEQLAEAGVNGSIRSVQLDSKRKLLLVDRHSTVNDSRVFELDAKRGFIGPYIIADQSYRTGLLTSGPPSHEDAVLWTLDSGNRLRYYSLAELRSDLSVDEVKAKAIDLKPGQIAPLALDRSGRHYGIRWNGSQMELFVDLGQHVRSKSIADGSVSEIVPADDGKSFLAVHQRSGGMAIAVYDSETLTERWTLSTGQFHSEVAWSPDGQYVGVAAQTGAVVHAAKSGEAVHQRCGLEFEVVGTAPSTAFSTVNQRTLCEP
jgi:hypothetical protein